MNNVLPYDQSAVTALIAARVGMPGALLPILHAVQDLVGYIPSDVIPQIAEQLNLSRAEVHGVVTYYHHFRQQPVGRHVVQICRAEACQSRGSHALVLHAQAVLGCGFHETSADGEFTLEPAYCLGQCAVAPSMMVDEVVVGRASPAKFDRLIATRRGVV